MTPEEIEKKIADDLTLMQTRSATGKLDEKFIEEYTTLQFKKYGVDKPEAEVKTEVKTEAKVEEPKTEVKVEEPKTEVKTENNFLGGVLKNLNVATEKEEIKDLAQVEKVVKEKYKKDTLSDFFGEFDTIKQRVDEELPKVQKERDDVVAVFQNLPEDLWHINQIAIKKGDWREAAKGVIGMDFMRDVSKIGKEELVNYFYPQKFKKEDFEDVDGTNTALEIAYDESKNKFIAKQNTIRSQSEKMIADEQKRTQVIAGSIESSFKALENTIFKDTPPEHVGKTKKVMSGGKDAILAMFYNEDGSYKPDAAKKILLAEFGEDAMKDIASVVSKRAGGEALEEAIQAKKETNLNGGGAANKSDKEKQEEARARIRQRLGMNGLNPQRKLDHSDKKK